MGKREARQRDQRVETGGRNKDIGNGSGGGRGRYDQRQKRRQGPVARVQRGSVQRCSEGEWALSPTSHCSQRTGRPLADFPGLLGLRWGAPVGFFTPLVGWISWMIGCPSASACFCWGC